MHRWIASASPIGSVDVTTVGDAAAAETTDESTADGGALDAATT